MKEPVVRDKRRIACRTFVLLALTLSMVGAGPSRTDGAADERIRQRVQMKLAGQVAVHIESLDVRVQDGSVRLAGTVGSLGEKLRAERVAGGIVGVKSVTNDLVVKTTDRSEIAIAQDVRHRLETRTRFKRTPVQVTVSGTEVTLSGQVERGLDRVDAQEIAADAPGVTRVINNVQVKGEGSIPDESIRSRVLSILANPLTFGVIRHLEVTVEGGAVTLRGTVTREADRVEAERLALS